ncbi:MAG: hypothetical protein JW720_10130 [Sedimentisphaerales bacterium]|nr:hypothetical protein [Sedimentisphaerales bacterium]
MLRRMTREFKAAVGVIVTENRNLLRIFWGDVRSLLSRSSQPGKKRKAARWREMGWGGAGNCE